MICRIRFPCPLPGRGNRDMGRRRSGKARTRAHWSGEASLAAAQKAATAAALSGCCQRCGVPWRSLAMRGGHQILAPACEHIKSWARPHHLPPHGPDHPVDVLLVRTPRKSGNPLDLHDGLRHACKSPVDAVTAALWPKDRNGKPTGTPNDNAPWLRWEYGQDKRRPGDPEDCETLEIVVAPRDDCCGCGRSTLPDRWLRGEI